MWDSLTESFVNDKIIEMAEDEFVHHRSTIINHIGSGTIKEARECSDVTRCTVAIYILNGVSSALSLFSEGLGGLGVGRMCQADML